MSNRFPPLSHSVSRLETKARQGKCLYIRSMRFPNYKGLAPDEEIDFSFPVTVLLGRNGTNKSSVLHALYGAPHRKSISDFWFSTEVDGIPATRDGVKQSVVYSYVKDGQDVHFIKARAPRKDDPDYWEAQKKTGVYGFAENTGEREPPIQLNVELIDFRGQLPAFDKYFYFPDEYHLKVLQNKASKRNKDSKRGARKRRTYRKQDYLRARSPQLRKKVQNATPLKPNELNAIRYILEREYAECSIVSNGLYRGYSGYTVVFKQKTQRRHYSEAFAGSGESAVALLVHKLSNIDKGSLVLLDEPETSLHPAAQKRMMSFIAKVAADRNLQVVMSTHSIYMAEDLPISARRVMRVDDESGFVKICIGYSAKEALMELSGTSDVTNVVVEDERAKVLIEKALTEFFPQSDRTVIVHVGGGVSEIYSQIKSLFQSGDDSRFFVLDGDHCPVVADESSEYPSKRSLEHFEMRAEPGEGFRRLIDAVDLDAIPRAESYIDSLLAALTKKAGLKFRNEDEKLDFIRYFLSHVLFLPSDTPESCVWSDTTVAKLLDVNELPARIVEAETYKMKIFEAASELGMNNDEQDAFYMLCVAHYLKGLKSTNSNPFAEIMDMIRGI